MLPFETQKIALDGVPDSVRVAVTFGGTDQRASFVPSSSVTLPRVPVKRVNAECRGWDANRLGSSIELRGKNKREVTRTSSAGWACQVVDTEFALVGDRASYPVRSLSFRIVNNGSSHLYLGLMSTSISAYTRCNFLTSSVHDVDGVWTVNASGDTTGRLESGTHSSFSLPTGTLVEFDLDLARSCCTVRVNKQQVCTFVRLPRSVIPFVQFGGSDQVVALEQPTTQVLLCCQRGVGRPLVALAHASHAEDHRLPLMQSEGANLNWETLTPAAAVPALYRQPPMFVALQRGRLPAPTRFASPAELASAGATTQLRMDSSFLVASHTGKAMQRFACRANAPAAIIPRPRELASALPQVSYYEVTLQDLPVCDPPPTVSMGLALSSMPLSKTHVGWTLASFAYHSIDGVSSRGSRSAEQREASFGPTFKHGDTVGCGIVTATNDVFFTKNGTLLGVAFPGAEVPSLAHCRVVAALTACAHRVFVPTGGCRCAPSPQGAGDNLPVPNRRSERACQAAHQL